MNKMAFTISEAADQAGVSPDILRRAIKSTDPRSFPPPLRAKRNGAGTNARNIILAAELQRWLESLPDA